MKPSLHFDRQTFPRKIRFLLHIQNLDMINQGTSELEPIQSLSLK